MANLGADFSISAHIGTAPQQPGLIKLWHALCTNVDPFELVYLSDNFTPAQVATFMAAAPATRAADVITHLLSFPPIGRPDRGTALETIKAQYAYPFWLGGTVVQTPHAAIYDYDHTGPPTHAGAVDPLPESDENKAALGRYIWKDPGPAARAARTAAGHISGFYLCTEHEFLFEDDPNGQSQVQALMNGTIDNVSHDFISPKLPDRSVTSIRIPAAQYRHNMNTRGATPNLNSKCAGKKRVVINGTQLAAQDPARVLGDGTAVPSFWPDANGPPPDVYNVPLTPGDLARTFQRIIATTHPGSYRTPAQGPLGVRLGRIVG